MSRKLKHPSGCSCMFCRGMKWQRKQERKRKAKEALIEPKEDQFNSDAEADGDALASAGHGTDEDYGSASELL